MEETLGARIACHRKRLALTQDQLAEKLGVTAQAVSKWENNQSCPDISTLPKLAAIFEITTDELLGVESPKRMDAEVAAPVESSGPHFEFQFDSGKKDHTLEFSCSSKRKWSIGVALWIMLSAVLLLAVQLHPNSTFTLWSCMLHAGLLVYGLFGLYPRFSAFRLGCALLGGYWTLNSLYILPDFLRSDLSLPLFLLLFGLGLLVDALRKPNRSSVHINTSNIANRCSIDDETFQCAVCFGEEDFAPQLPRLSGGTAQATFGEMTIDLRNCQTIAPNCPLSLKCSFGELELRIPQGCRAEWTLHKSFGNLDVSGTPSPNASIVLLLDCDISFGQISILYL